MSRTCSSNPGPSTKVISKRRLITERVSELFKSMRWADIKFNVGEGDDQESFRAHKIILSSSSPVFEAMCFGPASEIGVVEVPDVKPEVFKELLSFIYLDHVKFSSPLIACGIHYAAKKYHVAELPHLCIAYIKSNMTTKDICLVYEYLQSARERGLEYDALEYIRRNTSQILKENSFLQLKSDTVKIIFDQNTLALHSEKQVLDAVLHWAVEECKRRDLETSSENLRVVMDPLLSGVRFLSFDHREFVSRKELLSILTAREYSDILSNLIIRDSCPLPPFINSMPRVYALNKISQTDMEEKDKLETLLKTLKF